MLPNPSAGVPLTYYCYRNSITSVKNLCINFLTTAFHAKDECTYRKTGFNPYKTLTQVFTNKYTATYASNTTVTYLTYDNNTVTGIKTAGTLKVRAMTSDARYQKLFNLGVYYWLASAGSDYHLWYVYNYGNVGNNGYNSENGIRPVVSLESDVRASGTDIKKAWNIEI